jgi:hypothetical protein
MLCGHKGRYGWSVVNTSSDTKMNAAASSEKQAVFITTSATTWLLMSASSNPSDKPGLLNVGVVLAFSMRNSIYFLAATEERYSKPSGQYYTDISRCRAYLALATIDAGPRGAPLG